MTRPQTLRWLQIHWGRPTDPARAHELVRHLAADQRSPVLTIEARGSAAGIEYLVGVPPVAVQELSSLFAALLPGTRLTGLGPGAGRQPIGGARQLKASTRHRALRTRDPESSSRLLLAALSKVTGSEVLVLQMVLGPRRIPLAVPTKGPSSTVAPWWFVLTTGNGGTLDSEKRSALRDKVSDHGFACSLRIGVNAGSPARRRQLAQSLVAALRTTEAAGLRLRPAPVRAIDVTTGSKPRLRWPLRLNASEVLALTAWPFGDSDLPGTAPLHPRRLPPAPGTTVVRPTKQRRIVAASSAPGVRDYLALSATDALRHTHVMAPTGAGKSVLLGRLIQQDIAAGRAVVVIEPKGDLIRDVLEHIPDNRRDDVVIVDPAADAPIGLNPLVSRGRPPEVIADSLLTVFRALYADSWGPRLQDILHASLLTLARRGDASLVMLPLLLTNTGFRRSLTSTLDDPIALGPFWAWYENLSEAERAAVIAPLMNKLRPWLFSPRLRAVLGQREPRFDLREVFTRRRILLVPLRSGIIGGESARLLGSLLVAQLWQTIQARAAIDPVKRHPVMIYIDEFQEYAASGLPTDLSNALAQARGLGAGFTMAHQYLHQLNIELRAGVLANARSRILFQLSHDDALTMSKGHPEIAPEDLTSLGPYEIYASLFAGGQVTPYASGTSLPPGPAISNPDELRALSQSRYGRPLDEVEASFADLLSTQQVPGAATGRRPRSGGPA